MLSLDFKAFGSCDQSSRQGLGLRVEGRDGRVIGLPRGGSAEIGLPPATRCLQVTSLSNLASPELEFATQNLEWISQVAGVRWC